MKTRLAILFFLIGGITSLLAQAPSNKEPQALTSDTQVPLAQSAWWQQTTIYQIYPRSFQDSNGDGIGDLAGIISRLDYLQRLGIETIWISPFYESPQRDFGYDISAYRDIDADYGNLTLVDSLISEAHKRNMKIVFDLVLNHTSDQHDWFIESAESRNNPKSDWYIWRYGKGAKPDPRKRKGKAPNNWVNVFNKDAWHYHAGRQQWYYTAFLDFQPDLNWRNPEVRAEMYGIVKYWLEKDVDGFRLDIFNCLLEDPGLRNNPRTLNPIPSSDGMRGGGQRKQNNINYPDNYTIAKELRTVIDSFSNPQRFVIGEVFGGTAAIKPYLGKNADGLNLVFDFDLIFFDFNANFFREKIKEYEKHFPAPYMPTLVYGNHDNFRSMGRIKGDERKAGVLAAFQLTARGVPVIYYGEEIGMRNGDIPKQQALDPISHEFKGIPPFMRNWLPVPLNRDVCRTPMQWEYAKHAGFCPPDQAPWLPLAPEVDIANVESQREDSYSLLNTYMNLLGIRRTHEALQQGRIQLLEPPLTPKPVLAYLRSYEQQTIFIALNFSGKSQAFPWTGGATEKLLGLNTEDEIRGGEVTLSPYGGLIVKLDTSKKE